jgi:hypothetical protein
MAKDQTELAQENMQRAIQAANQAANIGADWITEIAEQNLGQSKAAVTSVLTLTRKAMDGFGQQASAVQNHSLAFAGIAFDNAFSFGKKILQVRKPTEFAQAQTDFLSSQAQALSDHAKKLGSVFEEANQTAKTSMQEARETARRREAA